MRLSGGAVPAGLITVPIATDWTPERIKRFESECDALVAGNDQRRNRFKALPRATVTTPAPDWMTPSDQVLLNVIVACFGLTMAELGFTEDVDKSSGASLENALYCGAVRPSANFITALFGAVIKRFANPRYKVAWQKQEEDDNNSQAERVGKLIPIRASVDDYCAADGQPKPGIDRHLMTTQGPALDRPRSGYSVGAADRVRERREVGGQVALVGVKYRLAGRSLVDVPSNSDARHRLAIFRAGAALSVVG